MTPSERHVSPPVRLPAVASVAESAPIERGLYSPIYTTKLNHFETAEPLQLKLDLPKTGPTIGGWFEVGYTRSGF